MLGRLALRPAACITMAAIVGAQTFVDNTTDVPTGTPDNATVTAQVDFADVDGDGDFDAVFATGGWENGLFQNRLWINQGGAQGGAEGTFLDRTTTQLPMFVNRGGDVEFADLDGDGDVDLYFANLYRGSGAPSSILMNAGAASGYFVDETAQRWVALGENGSSIDPSLVYTTGGFIDWSSDADFADLDDDGDLDLVHTSYGYAGSGTVPTRIFRNNGFGYFREFDPSGYQLTGANIPEGAPGLWCEGVHEQDATSTDGTTCDVATDGVAELGDTDGDLDIDFLLGDTRHPRFFRNLFEENGRELGFRDVTELVFPPGYESGSQHSDQELGDLDGDGDLDVYGVNWQSTGTRPDRTLENLGDGTFGDVRNVAGTDASAAEADFLDYDGDGDLDVFVASTNSTLVLLRNDSTPGSGLTFVDVGATELPFLSIPSSDGEACDLDGDGDQDLFVSTSFYSLPTNYLENTGSGTDVHAPRIPRIEQAADRAAGPDPTSVRAQVYDNAAYYAVWYYDVQLEYRVDGGAPQAVPMRSSGAQIFRGEIPGDVVGSVEYRVLATDRAGNQGSSAFAGFTASPDLGVGTRYCSGDGSGTACPCHNEGHVARGCANGASHGGARLSGEGSTSLGAGDLVLRADGLVPNQPGLYFQGDQRVAGGSGSQFGDGLRCAGGHVVRLQVRTADSGGNSATTLDVGLDGGAAPGDTKRYQLWYRDPTASLCGGLFNLTNGVEIVWQL